MLLKLDRVPQGVFKKDQEDYKQKEHLKGQQANRLVH
jgi:hypothetical protein